MVNCTGRDLNVSYKEETNYSIIAEGTDVWPGELPFKSGDVFPPTELKERALISHTNKLVYQNNSEDIYSSIISVFPEIEPMYGWQVREIVAKLPYFKNATNYWISLIAGEPPKVDGDDEIDIKVNDVIENTNWGETIQNEVRSRFMDCIGAYRVDINLTGKPVIVPIEAKNLICYVNKQYTSDIEVNLVTNKYTDDDGKKYVEFIEYHYNGYIVKTVFEYSDGKLGALVEDKCDLGRAFDGKYEMSPIVIFKHNTTGNEIYGTDQFRYWNSSVLGAMRGLQNIFRLGERTREMIRKVPDSAIKKNSATGESMFFNKGTISYPDGSDKSPDVSYEVPEIRMEEAVKAFEKAIKSVSIDTNLGPVFFDLEKLGTNLSSKSIEAALYPTKLEAKRIATEMTGSIKELVIKLCALADIDLTSSAKFSIMWFDGFPQDIKDVTDAIQKRLGDKQSISLPDAIMKLDKVSSRIAKQKAAELETLNNEVDTKVTALVEGKNENLIINDECVNLGGLEGHSITPSIGAGGAGTTGDNGTVDNTVWETQMYPTPNDISLKNKEVSKEWIKRKLRQKA